RLFLRSYEQNRTALFSQGTNEIVSFFYFLDCLLEINNIDPVTFGEDVFFHFGVPATSLMTEMYPCFKQLFHGNNRHLHTPPLLLVLFGTLRLYHFHIKTPFRKIR